MIYKIPIIIFIDTEKFEDGEMIQWGRRLPPRPEDPGLVSGMNVVESTQWKETVESHKLTSSLMSP